MELDDTVDPFAIEDLWKRSIFSHEDGCSQDTLFPPIEVDLQKSKIHNPYAPQIDLEHDLRLPDLEAFAFGPLEDLQPSEASVISTEAEQHDELAGDEYNIWDSPWDLKPLIEDVRYFTWEAFENTSHEEPITAYISESQPEAFHAAIQSEQEGEKVDDRCVSQSSELIKSTFLFGLGRPSALYPDATMQSPLRISGCSAPLSEDIQEQFHRCGRAFSDLRRYVNSAYSGHTFPAKAALGVTLSSILSIMEEHLGARLSSIRSLVQLQLLFTKASSVVVGMERALEGAKSARSNEELVGVLYHEVQTLEHENSQLRAILLEALSRTSQPWLSGIGRWTGLLTSQPGIDNAFDDPAFVAVIKVTDEQTGAADVEYEYNPKGMPAFIPEEDARVIFETGKGLRCLCAHQAEHPLSNPSRYDVQPPGLQWKFHWDDADRISQKAKIYEQSISQAIRNMRSTNGIPEQARNGTNDAGVEPAVENAVNSLEDDFRLTAERFDAPPPASYDNIPDSLQDLVASALSSSVPPATTTTATFPPPISLSPLLSIMPAIRVQSRVVAAATTRLFLQHHHLRHHLQLHSCFHLLTDGVFVARLTASLLDPAVSSVERQRGVMRTGERMGLKLGTRDIWPPASSELRLALAGVLSDCYDTAFPQGIESFIPHNDATRLQSRNESSSRVQEGSHPHHDHGLSRPKPRIGELPGQLGFSIRTLSPSEVSKCLDPHSLQALDFLRLQYAPPSPLGAVISSAALDKLDAVFKFLLRLLRVRWVTERTAWAACSHRSHNASARSIRTRGDATAHRFRLDARHFVQACAGYFFETGVRETWTEFERWLDGVEARLAADDASPTSTGVGHDGIEALRARLEQTLDTILWRLLLRHRQAKVLAVLEEVWSTVLAFANIDRTDADDGDDAQERKARVRELYDRFRSNVSLFLTVCKGLADKRGYGKGVGSGELNTVERLVVALEMNGYYASSLAPS